MELNESGSLLGYRAMLLKLQRKYKISIPRFSHSFMSVCMQALNFILDCYVSKIEGASISNKYVIQAVCSQQESC